MAALLAPLKRVNMLSACLGANSTFVRSVSEQTPRDLLRSVLSGSLALVQSGSIPSSIQNQISASAEHKWAAYRIWHIKHPVLFNLPE